MPLRQYLDDHSVDTAYELGWSDLQNGESLDIAEREGFEVLVTTDQSLEHQQHLARRSLGVIILMSTSWPRIEREIDNIREALQVSTPGTVQRVRI